VLENWARDVNPSDQDSKPYPGWPVVLDQEDNYGRRPYGYLPEIKVSGMVDPVFQLVHENRGEIVYTIRIKGSTYIPKIYEEGTYTIRIGDPDTEMKEILHLNIKDESPIEIEF